MKFLQLLLLKMANISFLEHRLGIFLSMREKAKSLFINLKIPMVVFHLFWFMFQWFFLKQRFTQLVCLQIINILQLELGNQLVSTFMSLEELQRLALSKKPLKKKQSMYKMHSRTINSKMFTKVIRTSPILSSNFRRRHIFSSCYSKWKICCFWSFWPINKNLWSRSQTSNSRVQRNSQKFLLFRSLPNTLRRGNKNNRNISRWKIHYFRFIWPVYKDSGFWNKGASPLLWKCTWWKYYESVDEFRWKTACLLCRWQMSQSIRFPE